MYQPDKGVMASRLEAYAFDTRGLGALSPSPPGAKLKAPKAPQLAGMRGSAQRQAFYAQHEVDVPGAKAKCCSLGGAPELITGFTPGGALQAGPCVARRGRRTAAAHMWADPPFPKACQASLPEEVNTRALSFGFIPNHESILKFTWL